MSWKTWNGLWVLFFNLDYSQVSLTDFMGIDQTWQTPPLKAIYCSALSEGTPLPERAEVCPLSWKPHGAGCSEPDSPPVIVPITPDVRTLSSTLHSKNLQVPVKNIFDTNDYVSPLKNKINVLERKKMTSSQSCLQLRPTEISAADTGTTQGHHPKPRH